MHAMQKTKMLSVRRGREQDEDLSYSSSCREVRALFSTELCVLENMSISRDIQICFPSFSKQLSIVAVHDPFSPLLAICIAATPPMPLL